MTDGERLAVLAHELRSPVAALVALAEQARTAAVAGALSRVISLAVSAGRDVERLLADPEVVSVRPVPLDLGELLRGLARPRVAVDASRIEVVADPTRLRQAFANLVANGLRHGSAVSVAARGDGHDAIVLVRDDGPGVAASIDPFERGASAAGSTGYGLWLARAIAEAHGGTLTLEPSSGSGTTFRLALPLAPSGLD
jgi:signal transduction histidine kinase